MDVKKEYWFCALPWVSNLVPPRTLRCPTKCLPRKDLLGAPVQQSPLTVRGGNKLLTHGKVKKTQIYTKYREIMSCQNGVWFFQRDWRSLCHFRGTMPGIRGTLCESQTMTYVFRKNHTPYYMQKKPKFQNFDMKLEVFSLKPHPCFSV